MVALLQSREFWAMIVSIVISIIVALVPQLEPHKVEIIAAINVLVGIIIATFGTEKTAAAKASGLTKLERQSGAKSETVIVKSP